MIEHRVEWWRGGVVWVDVVGNGWRHRLQGMDHYWIDGDRFGMFNSTDQYTGRPAVAYQATPNGVIDLGDLIPDVEVMDGIMLPDDLARECGLL